MSCSMPEYSCFLQETAQIHSEVPEWVLHCCTVLTAVSCPAMLSCPAVLPCRVAVLQDKKYCATINVVLSGYTVSNAPSGFPKQITLPFDVCWYKHNGQASARFNFGSCGKGGGVC